MWYSLHVSRRQYQIGMLTIHSGHDDCNLRTSGGRYWIEIPCYWEADMVNAETQSSWVDAGGWDLTGSCSTLMLRSWYFRARHQEGVLMRTSDDTSRQTLLPSDCPVDINAVGSFKHDVYCFFHEADVKTVFMFWCVEGALNIKVESLANRNLPIVGNALEQLLNCGI